MCAYETQISPEKYNFLTLLKMHFFFFKNALAYLTYGMLESLKSILTTPSKISLGEKSHAF